MKKSPTKQSKPYNKSKKKINPNLRKLVNAYQSKRGIILEGSSRSGKTWSSVDFIIYLCTRIETNCTINVIKETYNSFKTTLYDDFARRLPNFGIYSPFLDKKEVDSFRIFGNKINFLGADKPSKFHGASCDYFWINEAMDVSKDIFDQSEMRCRKFWWMDYNPKLSVHWIYNDVSKRPDVELLKTTFIENPYISQEEKNKILSYEPTFQNIENGTADDYKWKVYGLGERTPPEGLIFRYINWIDKFPDMGFVYGLDFGFTVDPTVLTKVAQDEKNIYVECLSYEPMETSETLNNYMEAIGIDKYLPIIADSSDRFVSERKGVIEMVRELRDECGWEISKVSKTKSVMFWLNKMKEKKIHIVKNKFHSKVLQETENYRMKLVNGIAINQPEDEFNHFFDSGRYAYMALNQNYSALL